MKQITYEEFRTEIDEMCKDLMARKKAQGNEAGLQKVIATSKPYVPPFVSQYEHLHAYDLDSEETENGAKYDSCRWRYKQCTEPTPWEKCWYEDWAN